MDSARVCRYNDGQMKPSYLSMDQLSRRQPYHAVRLVAFLAYVLLAAAPHAAEPTRPNIILILADDLGFSDVGCFGSEISTPNIDRLARDGVALTQFYNQARCCPTRATL